MNINFVEPIPNRVGKPTISIVLFFLVPLDSSLQPIFFVYNKDKLFKIMKFQ